MALSQVGYAKTENKYEPPTTWVAERARTASYHNTGTPDYSLDILYYGSLEAS